MVIFRTQDALNASASNVAEAEIYEITFVRSCYEESEKSSDEGEKIFLHFSA